MPTPDGGKKALGDAVAILEKSNDARTASKILENFGLLPAPQGEAAIAKLKELVATIKSEADLNPLEDAFSTTLNPNADHKIESPQGDVEPTPAATATPPPPKIQ